MDIFFKQESPLAWEHLFFFFFNTPLPTSPMSTQHIPYHLNTWKNKWMRLDGNILEKLMITNVDNKKWTYYSNGIWLRYD